MNFEYEIKNYIRPGTFGEWVSDLNRLGNESNCWKNIVRLTADTLRDLEMIVGKENVRSEIERFMDDGKVPKDVQEKYIKRFNIGE
jgi:hypothetical protein